jgi:hypothetical protein
MHGILIVMKTSGRINSISTSVSIFFDENRIGFGKYGFGNGIGICGCRKRINTDEESEN